MGTYVLTAYNSRQTQLSTTGAYIYINRMHMDSETTKDQLFRYYKYLLILNM